MSIDIRPAEPDDLPAIAGIYAHAVTHGTASYELEAPSLDEMRNRYQGLVSGCYPYLVAASGG